MVKDGSARVDAAQIIEHVSRRLGAKRAPRRIYFVNGLPRNDNGKFLRWDLPRLLGLEAPNAAGSSAKPTSLALPPLQAAVAGLWASALERHVGADDDFFLAGGDSLLGARLLASVKAAFGVDLAIDALFGEAATVAGMAGMIEKTRTAARMGRE